jgi:hypothetical protein
MTIRRTACSALILLVTCAASAAAQEPPQPPGRAGAARGAGDLADNPRVALELANALDKYALVQAKAALQLDEGQMAQFVPRLRALQQARRRNFQARHRILQELRRMAGPRAGGTFDEAVVRARLDALREQDERAAQELRAAYAALDEVLDVRQQARFRIFEENIEARKLELLMRARARAGRGGS